MAENTPTPNYNFNLPLVGGDDDAWGDLLNANWSSIDGLLWTVSGVANGALTQTLGDARYLQITGGSVGPNAVIFNGPMQANNYAGFTNTLAVSGNANFSGGATFGTGQVFFNSPVTMSSTILGVTPANPADNSNLVPTTAWVQNAIASGASSVTVGDTPPVNPRAGALWWDSVHGEMYLWYTDANSSQWVTTTNVYGSYLPLVGGTMTGPIVLAADPTVPLGAATKEYVDAGDSLALPASYYAGGFVNKLRNGTFDVWQRGTPITPTANAYGPDGWLINSVGTACAVSRGVMGSGSAGVRSASNCTFTGVAGNTGNNLIQRIESFSAAQLWDGASPVTLQAWVNNNTGTTFTPTANIAYPNATDNFAATTPITTITFQPCPPGAWTNIAYTIPPLPSNVQGGLSINIILAPAVAGQTIAIAAADIRATPGVPVGLNSNPPPPELRPIGVELAFCQRYFAYCGVNAVAYGWAGAASQAISVAHSAPVTMRAAPTVSGAWGQVVNATGGVVSALADRRTVFVSANSVTAGGGYIVVYTINNLSAEL